MTFTKKMTIASVAALTIGLSGAAWAGPGKDCAKHEKTAVKAEAQTEAPVVLGASATTTEAPKVEKAKTKTALTFDEARALCQSKDVADLQACIDKKTGKTKPAT